MAIVPAASTPRNEKSALRLARYAQRIEYNECAFFGVNAPNIDNYQCRKIWTKPQRDNIAFYLYEAQREIEDQLKYFLMPTWVVGQLSDEPNLDPRYVDEQPYRWKATTKWGAVIEAGVKAETVMQAGAVVDQTSDPAVVTVVAGAAAIDEVVVYHPGTTVQIDPSSIVLSGANYVISIPRCRTVKSALVNNDEQGLDYADVNNFEATVDVSRVYNDPSTNALLAHKNRCTNPACAETTQTACLYFENLYTGLYEIQPATYDEDAAAWQRSCSSFYCNAPKVNRLYYRSGLSVLDEQMEDSIIRLAHSKMPNEPCGCDITQRMWERDRNIPTVISQERAMNPFGLSDGAWIAWAFVRTRKLYRIKVM
jgi:hypothetical protein